MCRWRGDSLVACRNRFVADGFDRAYARRTGIVLPRGFRASIFLWEGRRGHGTTGFGVTIGILRWLSGKNTPRRNRIAWGRGPVHVDFVIERIRSTRDSPRGRGPVVGLLPHNSRCVDRLNVLAAVLVDNDAARRRLLIHNRRGRMHTHP